MALYFENSILAPDLPLLSSAAANVDKIEQDGARFTVDSRDGVGIPWQGPALVNGRLWPVRSEDTLWLPAGSAVVQPAQKESALRILDFNGNLRTASASGTGLEFSYQSSARALALVNTRPSKIEIDGAASEPASEAAGPNYLLVLPRGQHIVRLETAGSGLLGQGGGK